MWAIGGGPDVAAGSPDSPKEDRCARQRRTRQAGEEEQETSGGQERRARRGVDASAER